MSGVTSKVCGGICGEDKPLTEYSPHKQGRHGVYPRCRPCQALYSRERRAARGAQPRGKYLTDEQRKERERLWRRRAHLKRKFGISIEEYERMLAQQEGCCAICGLHGDEVTRNLSVDHCHTTGAVRGLLCNPCNAAIGLLRENPDNLRRAIDYLGGHDGR